MVQKTFFALTNSLPPRKPGLRSTWRMDLNVSHKNCGRQMKDRTRKRVTEINAILSSAPFRRNCYGCYHKTTRGPESRWLAVGTRLVTMLARALNRGSDSKDGVLP